MNVADNIIRVLNALESARLAAKVLLASLLLAAGAWLLRAPIQLLGEELGIAQVLVYGVLALAIYSLAVLVVEGGLRLGGIVTKARAERALVRRARAESQELKRKRIASLKHFLDHAPQEYLRPLRELWTSGELEYARSGELRRLEEIRAVERLVETRINYAVFRLAAESKAIIHEYFEAERKAHVLMEVKRLSNNELAFLELFTVEQTQYEDPDQTELLPRGTYSGGESLARKNLVQRAGVQNERLRERWSLLADAKEAIASEHGLTFKRHSVDLGRDRVEAGAASGGGAR